MYQLILVEKLKKRREWGDLFCYFHVLFSPYSPACLFHSLFFSNENTNVFTVKKNELWYSYFPSSPSSLTRIREMMLQKKRERKKKRCKRALKKLSSMAPLNLVSFTQIYASVVFFLGVVSFRELYKFRNR